MYQCRYIFYLIFLPIQFLFAGTSAGTIFPAENAVLNYRIVGFTFPITNGTIQYTIQVARGRYNSIDSFKKNVIIVQHSAANRIACELPAFGTEYTWMVIAAGKNREDAVLHHFATGSVPQTDTAICRLHILQQATQNKDGYVFIDGPGVLYDMNGLPVWYLPVIEGRKIAGNTQVRDLKLSPKGTITFLIGEQVYETDYNGTIKWKGPEKALYHHEFTRLANGHYMALGNEVLWCRVPDSSDTMLEIAAREPMPGDSGYVQVEFATIIEYDRVGRKVWSWSSRDHFVSSDIVYHTGSMFRPYISAHGNSFYFDEKKNEIYLSFRNISRIIKIKYATGQVIATYGEQYKPGIAEHGNGLFCGQHSCSKSEYGYLYLFNNNMCNAPASPVILKLKEGNGKLEKVWEYNCATADEQKHERLSCPSGGSVTELPDGRIFACMPCTNYNKLLIVNKNKKELWSALLQRRTKPDEQWESGPTYKASYINRAALVQLIWNTGQ